MNHGFDEKLIDIKPEDYHFGALPQDVLQEDSDWTEYLPVFEPQADKYETWGCTIYGGQTQIQTYMKRVFGFEPNFNERFNYVLAGVDIGGANPQDGYESFRKDGLIDDELEPSTFEEFKNPSYINTDRKNRGKKWLEQYTLKHEWLINPSKEEIVESLKYSPIAIAVTAWHEEDGLFVDRGSSNTHWCECYGYIEDERGIMLKIFDSYDKSHKLLHPDHRTSVAKRIWIYKSKPKKSFWAWIFNLIFA